MRCIAVLSFCLLFSVFAFLPVAAVDPEGGVEIDSMDQRGKWQPVGNAKVLHTKRGHRGGALIIDFGGETGKRSGIVQTRPDATSDAWERRGTLEPNAFSFYARSDENLMLRVNLRVRQPGVGGPKGVIESIGAHVRIRRGGWRNYTVSFSEFDTGRLHGKKLQTEWFEKYHPQFQFACAIQRPGNAARVTIDELAFVRTDAARPDVLREETADVWPGIDRVADAVRLSEGRVSPVAVGWSSHSDAPGFAASEARRVSPWIMSWSFLPVGADGVPGTPTDVALPHGWPGRKREYMAAWYVARVVLPEAPRSGHRVFACFDRVSLFGALFVNGRKTGSHRGAFTPFEIDVTSALQKGENVLALYVHDMSAAMESQATLYMMGSSRPQDRTVFDGGVCGGIRLLERSAVHVSDVFVETSVARGEIAATVEVRNLSDGDASAGLRFALMEWPGGGAVESVSLPDATVRIPQGGVAVHSVRAAWPSPRLWSPESPSLYVLRVVCDAGDAPGDVRDVRFGFREFGIDGKRFMLNGKPVRLLGESHFRYGRFPQAWHPESGLDFLCGIMRRIKADIGANSARVHAMIQNAHTAQAADEIGLMLINQSSIWSSWRPYYARGGERFLANAAQEFSEWVRRDRNSPSVVIWDVENEMIRGARVDMPWVMQLDDMVLKHDRTRPIEHSGAGWYHPRQQIVHLHMQEHYSGILEKWRDEGTRPLIIGEFWIGGRGETRLPSSLEFADADQWFEEEGRIYEEQMLEMRHYGASGIMPFRPTESLYGDQFALRRTLPKGKAGGPGLPMRSEAMARRIRHGFDPVCVFFWPRCPSVVAGRSASFPVALANDSSQRIEATVRAFLGDARVQELPVACDPGEIARLSVGFAAPDAPTSLRIEAWRGSELLSTDEIALRPVSPERLRADGLQRRVSVWEPASGRCVEVLERLGVKATVVADLPDDPVSSIWIVGPGATDARRPDPEAVRRYLEGGGRVLCLAQHRPVDWAPVRPGFWSAVREAPIAYRDFGWPADSRDIYFARYAPIYAPRHPVFEGIGGSDLRWWSSRDGRVSDAALVRPATVGMAAGGAWRVLAGASRRENIAIAEARVGAGVFVWCQAHVIAESASSEAAAVFGNMLRYLDGAGWTGGRRVAVVGEATPESLATQTGAPVGAFQSARAEDGDVMIATDGADSEAVEGWARAGGRVLVLSPSLASRFAGCPVARDPNRTYAGSRASDHPLFRGVATGSFLGFEEPCVEGSLEKCPDGWRVLLNGLSGKSPTVRRVRQSLAPRGITAMEASGPVAVVRPLGKGEIVLTTLAPWRRRSLHNDELMSLFLANAGVDIAPASSPLNVRAFASPASRLDGRLAEWQSDMEDRNVSEWRHAEPVLLQSCHARDGGVERDTDLSGILYFLHDDTRLYVAGVAFGEGERHRFEIEGAACPIVVSLEPQGASLFVAGSRRPSASIGSAAVQSGEVADARYLALTRLDRRAGYLERDDRVPGRTFEAVVPWSDLAPSGKPELLSLRVRLVRLSDDSVLEPPAFGLSPAP